jgi:hypothetical protein
MRSQDEEKQYTGTQKKTGDQTSFLAQIGPSGSFTPSFGFQDQTPFNYMYKC